MLSSYLSTPRSVSPGSVRRTIPSAENKPGIELSFNAGCHYTARSRDEVDAWRDPTELRLARIDCGYEHPATQNGSPDP